MLRSSLMRVTSAGKRQLVAELALVPQPRFTAVNDTLVGSVGIGRIDSSQPQGYRSPAEMRQQIGPEV